MADGGVLYLKEFGDVPWDPTELGAALEYAARLHHTPRDDWDRVPRRFAISTDDGNARHLVLSPDVLETQIGLWLVDRIRKQGLSVELQQKHLWRFMEARQFLLDNIGRLSAEGLVCDDPEDQDALQIEECLIAVLATAPYEGVRLQGGDPVPTFHCEKVVAAANDAMK